MPRPRFYPLFLLAGLALVTTAAGCDRKAAKEKGGGSAESDVPTGTKGAKGKKKKLSGNTDMSALDDADLVADLGFRPNPDGFGFPNYVVTDPDDLPLGPKDLRKMCGDKAVCAGGGDDDECTLKSGAQAFLDHAGKMLGGGHCEGFSVGSLRIFAHEDDVEKLGGEDVFGLDKKKKVERYLAYWAVSQLSPTVAKATIRSTPNNILDRLMKTMKAKSETYVLGIYRSDGTGGHAIVPYAVEDRGDDVYWVHVYENNSPGTLRHLEFDKNANTWVYDDAQINPSEAPVRYEGDEDSPRIELIPQSSRKNMACPFAGGGKAKPAPVEEEEEEVEEEEEAEEEVAEEDDDMMITSRSAKLTVEDESGHTLGLKDGKLVSEIPGATFVIVRSKYSSNMPPVLIVPAKTKINLTVRGDAGKEDDVAIIGRKFAATLTGVQLEAKPAGKVEIDGKAKQIAFVGAAPAAKNVILTVDKGSKVKKLELTKAAIPALGVGGKLQVNLKKGLVAVAATKAAPPKPLALKLVTVAKVTKAPKIDALDVAKPTTPPPAAGTAKPAPVEAKPVEAKPLAPKTLLPKPGAEPAAPEKPGPVKPGAVAPAPAPTPATPMTPGKVAAPMKPGAPPVKPGGPVKPGAVVLPKK